MKEAYGKTFGIKINDGIISKIIRNFPILNVFYTKQVELHAVRRSKDGTPLEGLFTYTRIPNWWMKLVPIKFAFMSDSDHTLVYINDCTNDRWIASHEFQDPCILNHRWESISLTRRDVE